jgi:hypothetical protein
MIVTTFVAEDAKVFGTVEGVPFAMTIARVLLICVIKKNRSSSV